MTTLKKENEMVDAIPQGFSTITPHIIIKNATKAIEFYKKAFGSEIVSVRNTPVF